MTPEPVVPQSSSDLVGRVLEYWRGEDVRGRVTAVEARGDDWSITLGEVHTAETNTNDWHKASDSTRTLTVRRGSPVRELKDGRCMWMTSGGIVYILPHGSDLKWGPSAPPTPPPLVA